MFKYLATILIFLSMFYATTLGKEIWVDGTNGSDSNTGIESSPYKTFGKALTQLEGQNDHIHLSGIIRDGVHLKKLIYSKENPLIIDGHNKTIVYAFDGEFKPFDPKNVPPFNWKNIDVSDCHWILIKNMQVWGGASEAIKLEDSDPEIGLQHIRFNNVQVLYSGGNGVFSGAYYMNDIQFIGCQVLFTIYANDNNHGIYFSGGHWTGAADYPPCENFLVKNCIIAFTGGRHGIQFNGRFKNILLDGNLICHTELGAFSLIGCRNVEVKNNYVYGTHRSPIVIYDYVDTHYFDISTPEGLKAWQSCHHSSGGINIHHNNLFLGPTQWHKDQWHNNYPKDQPVININNEALKDGVPNHYFKNIHIHHNLIMSPWKGMIFYGGIQEVQNVKVYENMFWTWEPFKVPSIKAPYGNIVYGIDWLNENFYLYYNNKLFINPKIKQYPAYDFIDSNLDENKNYDWSKFHTVSNLYSDVASEMGIGIEADSAVQTLKLEEGN